LERWRLSRFSKKVWKEREAGGKGEREGRKDLVAFEVEITQPANNL
jgi:hypothetical protein